MNDTVEYNQQSISDSVLCPKVSVNVLIYNASWERVRATLNSIIMQKGINFEVIIIDDCSEVNHSDKIKDFFSRYNFTDYKFIAHKKNLGTVKTTLEAAQKSRTAYIRGIDQGDIFFDEYALRDSYDHIVNTDAEVTVSRIVYYRALSNPIEIIARHQFPQNIEAYNNPDDLRESYLIHDDIVSGINLTYKRDVFIQYLKEAIEEGLIYTEDLILRCMVFDKRRIHFLDRNTVYYEFGAGISTVKEPDTPYKKAILRDMFKIENLLLKRCETSSYDEFSKRLASRIHNKRKIRAEIEYRKSLKDRFGIAAVPVILARRLLRGAMIALGLEMKAEVSLEIGDIMTDTNVSTDFANLCMNRE